MTAYTTASMLVVSAIGTACSDVVIDSIVVERARGEPQVLYYPLYGALLSNRC